MIEQLNTRWYALCAEHGIEPVMPPPQKERPKKRRQIWDSLAMAFCRWYEEVGSGSDWRQAFDRWGAFVDHDQSDTYALRHAVHGELFARGVTTEPPEVG